MVTRIEPPMTPMQRLEHERQLLLTLLNAINDWNEFVGEEGRFAEMLDAKPALEELSGQD